MPEFTLDAGAVVLGALLGAPARFFVSGFFARRFGETFPWGTLVVNVSGAFMIGMIAAYAAVYDVSAQAPLWLFLVTGVCGSYTTVSSFSLQTRALARDGEPRRALSNAALSLGLCIAAVALGYSLFIAVAGGKAQ